MDVAIAERVQDQMETEFSRTVYPEGFPDLPVIPKDRYLDPGFFALEQEAIFARSWMYVGEEREFAEIGAYRLFDRAGPPVLVLRDDKGAIRAFYNTCSHRGAPVVRVGQDVGSAKRLRCQFHSWTYDLQGTLIAVPERRDFPPSFDPANEGLRPVRCETWRGLVFVNLDADAPDLRSWFGPIYDEVPWRSDLRGAVTTERMLNCNWKVALESFIEVYHISTVHPQTVFRTIDSRGTATELMRNGHSRMVVPSTKDALAQRRSQEWQPGPGASEHPVARESSWTYQWFPAMLAPGGADGFMFMRFWPVDVAHTAMEVTNFVPDWGEGPMPERYLGAAEGFDIVMDEDQQNMEPIQQSLNVPTYAGPKVSYHERRIYHMQEWVDRMIGLERVPPQLSVPQVLGHLIVD